MPVWLVIGLVIVTLVGGALWLRFGIAGETASEQSAKQAGPGYDVEAAEQRTQRLGKQYQNLINAEQNPAKLAGAARALVEQYPKHVPARRLCGLILARGGKTEAGYKQLDKALQLDNQARPRLQQLAGTMAMQLGRYEKALHHFGEAVSLEPQNARFRSLKAQALIEMDRFGEARTELLRALKQNSSSYIAHSVMAQLYGQKPDRLDQARKHIRKAIANLPAEKSEQRPKYVRQRAELLRRSHRYSDAISVLSDLPTEKLLTTPSLLKELAWNFHLDGQTGRAATMYRNALHSQPSMKWQAEGAVKWAIKAGRYEEARQLLNELRRLNATSAKLQKYRQQLDKAAGDDG